MIWKKKVHELFQLETEERMVSSQIHDEKRMVSLQPQSTNSSDLNIINNKITQLSQEIMIRGNGRPVSDTPSTSKVATSEKVNDDNSYKTPDKIDVHEAPLKQPVSEATQRVENDDPKFECPTCHWKGPSECFDWKTSADQKMSESIKTKQRTCANCAMMVQINIRTISNGKKKKKVRKVSDEYVLSEKLKSKKCTDCPLTVTPDTSSLFEYDHLPIYEKSFTIAKLQADNEHLSLISQEIKKCELVCRRCHRLRTRIRRKHEVAKFRNQ